MPIKYKEVRLATPLRLDLIVEGEVIVDNKAKAKITELDEQQLLTYLRMCDVRQGLLINFNVIRLVDGVHGFSCLIVARRARREMRIWMVFRAQAGLPSLVSLLSILRDLCDLRGKILAACEHFRPLQYRA